MGDDQDKMLVMMTKSELKELMKAASSEGAREVAHALRDDWLTTNQVADEYPVSADSVRKAVARGDLIAESRASRTGKGRNLIRRSEVEHWLRSKNQGAA